MGVVLSLVKSVKVVSILNLEQVKDILPYHLLMKCLYLPGMPLHVKLDAILFGIKRELSNEFYMEWVIVLFFNLIDSSELTFEEFK